MCWILCSPFFEATNHLIRRLCFLQRHGGLDRMPRHSPEAQSVPATAGCLKRVVQGDSKSWEQYPLSLTPDVRHSLQALALCKMLVERGIDINHGDVAWSDEVKLGRQDCLQSQCGQACLKSHRLHVKESKALIKWVTHTWVGQSFLENSFFFQICDPTFYRIHESNLFLFKRQKPVFDWFPIGFPFPSSNAGSTAGHSSFIWDVGGGSAGNARR